MLSTVLIALSLSTATASEAAPETATDASIQATPTYAEFAADGQSEKIKRPLLAAGLNWFLPGAGYAYNNAKPLYVTLPMMAGAVGLTYVENPTSLTSLRLIKAFADTGGRLERRPGVSTSSRTARCGSRTPWRSA